MEKLLIRGLTAIGFAIEGIISLLAIELAYSWLESLEPAVAGTIAFAVVGALALYGWAVGRAWAEDEPAPKPNIDWLFGLQMPKLGQEPVSAQARYEATLERLSQSQIKWVGKGGR